MGAIEVVTTELVLLAVLCAAQAVIFYGFPLQESVLAAAQNSAVVYIPARLLWVLLRWFNGLVGSFNYLQGA
jgi:hypothetical protein